MNKQDAGRLAMHSPVAVDKEKKCSDYVNNADAT